MALSEKRVLSARSSTHAERAARAKCANQNTSAEREELAKRDIQSALSEEELAKRAYEGPSPLQQL